MVEQSEGIGFAERTMGCIIGGAIGDAMGAPIEFQHIEMIHRTYGPDGIIEPPEIKGAYRFSDDTQMTVLTAYGLLFAETRMFSYGLMSHPMDYTWPAYRVWADKQGFKIQNLDDHTPWVMKYESMRSRRAPGNTCILSICGNDFRLKKEAPKNQSKGCGGLMRAAPAPIWCWKNGNKPGISMELAEDVAAATHGHPLGWMTAGFMGSLIHHILDGETLQASVDMAMEDSRKRYDHEKYLEEMMNPIEAAISLVSSDLPDEQCMETLGEGWVAEETLAMAVFACLRHPDDFRLAMRAAVNITGDSDSVGSVAGNILGAYLGIDAVDDAFDTHKLEDYPMLEQISKDLATVCPLGNDSYDFEWEHKYTITNDD